MPVRSTLLTFTGLAALTLSGGAPTPAYADLPEGSNGEKHSSIPAGPLQSLPRSAGVIEEIIVTGSHVRRVRRDGPAPVDVFDAADLERSGVNTLPDFARYLTYNLGVLNDEIASASPAPGTSLFNLRGIGAQNTLTLVNGWRIAPHGAPLATGHTFVDLNSIPLAAIERIEVLKDGASAIYGSEAVAGVVNVILKQNHEGLSVGGGYLSTTREDAQETAVDLTWGKTSARTSLTATASYLHRDPMLSRDRSFLAEPDLRSVGGFNLRHPFSSPPSAFRLDIERVQADPTCPTDPEHDLAFVLFVRQPHPLFDSLCTFNYKLFTHSIPETDRLGLTGMIRHELHDSADLFLDVIVNRNETLTQLAPPITDKASLGFPFSFVRADHPDNPFGSDLALNYRIVDVGPTTRDSESLSSRLVSGIEGSVDAWDWSASLLWSISKIDTEQFNVVDSVGFQNALLGLGGPGGNQYYNPFGFLPQNPADVISGFEIPVSLRSEEAMERAAEFAVTRRLSVLRGGPMVVGLGYQYRDQHASAAGDEFQTSGTALGIDLLRPLDATREINSAYVELALPVLATLELQLAGRYEHYSDFGAATNPKLAARWQATNAFAVRGSFGTSFRAPTFAELFETPQETLMFLVDTPRCAVTAAPTDCFPFPYPVFSGGNEQLEPEEGESWFLGLEWSPVRAKNFVLSVDLWRFDHDQRIVDVGAQFVIDEFGTDSDLVVRAPPLPTDPLGAPGPIELVRAVTLNVETLLTQGLDLDVRYRLPTARWGEFTFDMTHTYLDDYEFTESTNDELVDRNLAGSAEIFPLPRLRSNLTATWSRGSHHWAATLHYVGDYRSPLNLVVDDIETDRRVQIEDYLSMDLQYEHAFARPQGGLLRVGCQNCADAQPPVYNYTVAGEQLHDPRGAVVYLRWVQSFF